MKKFFYTGLLILLVILAGCGAKPEYDVKINQPLVYKQEKPSTLEIKVTEDEKAATDLSVHAKLTMLDMEHGTYEIKLEESDGGIYSGDIQLPMAGNWEIALLLEKDGESVEKILEEKVTEANGVAMINDQLITNQDIEFYRFINELHIAIARAKDKQTYEGEELKAALAYWDAQEAQVDNQNQLLTQIIRLRAMALLGEEKGFTAEEAKITEEINKVREEYNQHEIAQEMIAHYGEEQFWEKQQQQYKLIVLSQKVQDDVKNKVKQENPNVNEQEINYLAQKEYEELLVSQVNSLKIEIL